MKFDYIDLNTISENNKRLYVTPEGFKYPSITTILGNTMPEEKRESLDKWRNSIGHSEADRILKEAGVHGTAVHLLSERFLKGEQLIQENNEFTEENIACFNALKIKLKKIEEVWGQEIALYSNILKIAGRTDLIGVYKGRPCIIDFKTSINSKNDSKIGDYKLQLCAYACMHNELYNTDINHGTIFMTCNNGIPLEFNVNLNDVFDELMHRIDTFYAKFSV